MENQIQIQMTKKESLGLFKSIYLYGKLFLYYPFKYTLLFDIVYGCLQNLDTGFTFWQKVI